jgi:membrane-associated protease RseP (regulator of RpoE activity)
MIIALSLAIFALSVILHELAHGLAMRSNGIKVDAFGVGLPFPPFLRITLKGVSIYTLEITPWLVGAYVRANKEDIEKEEELSYLESSWINGSGIIVNALLGIALVGIVNTFWGDRVFTTWVIPALVAVWLSRKYLCAYLVPIISMPALLFLGWGIIRSFGEPVGAVSMAQMITSPKSLPDALELAAVINIGLAILNTIPLSMADGGHIIARLIKGRVPEKFFRLYKRSGILLIFGLTVYALLSDVLLVWQ